jgi:hypothetical protein
MGVNKIKVDLSLCVTKHHVIKTYGGVAIKLHYLLTSALGGGEWSASRPGRFNAGEISLGTQGKESCVSPRSGLDELAKEKSIHCLCGESNLDSTAIV